MNFARDNHVEFTEDDIYVGEGKSEFADEIRTVKMFQVEGPSYARISAKFMV